MRKAQVSLEFLLVTGVALFILSAASLFMFSYTQSSEEKSAIAQAAQIGYQIVDQARDVYVFGDGSYVSVTASLPDAVHSMYTTENNTLVLEIDSVRGTIAIPIFSDIPINGTAVDGEKTHVNNGSRVVHAGRTTYKVESMGDWVQIYQTS